MAKTILYIPYYHVDYRQNESNNQYLGYSTDEQKVKDFIQAKLDTEERIRQANTLVSQFHHDYPHYKRALSAEEFAEAVQTGTMDDIIQEWKTAEAAYQKLNIPKDILDRIYVAIPSHNYSYITLTVNDLDVTGTLFLFETDRLGKKEITDVYADEKAAKKERNELEKFEQNLNSYRQAITPIRHAVDEFQRLVFDAGLFPTNYPAKYDVDAMFGNLLQHLPIPEEAARILEREGVYCFAENAHVSERYAIKSVNPI